MQHSFLNNHATKREIFWRQNDETINSFVQHIQDTKKLGQELDTVDKKVTISKIKNNFKNLHRYRF